MKKVVVTISIELPEEAMVQVHSEAINNGQVPMFAEEQEPVSPAYTEPPMTKGQRGKLYYLLGSINPDPTLTKSQAQDLIGKLLKEQAAQKRQPTAKLSKESITFENEAPVSWEAPQPVKRKVGRPKGSKNKTKIEE